MKVLFKKNKSLPKLIIKREGPPEHYELHYDKEVVFETLEGKILGSSKVHKVK